MRKLWLVSVFVFWAAVGLAEDKCTDCNADNGASGNLLIEPDYVSPKTTALAKEQYEPVLEDDPPVKDRPVNREIKDGLILEEGEEAVIDTAPDFTPTHEEIVEDED